MKGCDCFFLILVGRASGKGAGARPPSLSSATGSDIRTASVRSTRAAAGQRTSAATLENVDTMY